MKTLALPGGWETLLSAEPRAQLEQRILPEDLPRRRWFAAKSRIIREVRIVDATEIGALAPGVVTCLLEVAYADGPPDRYVLTLVARPDHDGEPDVADPSILCRLETPGGPGWLRDALSDPAACRALLRWIAEEGRIPTRHGRFQAETTRAFGSTDAAELDALKVLVGQREQSNSAVIYGDRFLLKLFRKLDEGINPDVEIGRFLTEMTDYRHVPRTAGVIEYVPEAGAKTTVGLLQEFVPNEGTGWEHALSVLESYYERLNAQPDLLAPAGGEDRPILEIAAHSPPPVLTQFLADYLPFALQLGRRTAELHQALAGGSQDPDFAPEPIRKDDLAALSEAIRRQVETSLALLRSNVRSLDTRTQSQAHHVLERSDLLFEVLDDLDQVRTDFHRIRVHGDFHLGQVLRRGEDFVLIDFEGEPLKPLAERRAKAIALKDVVGMIRSFDYAAHAALFRFAQDDPEVLDRLRPWASAWQTWIAGAFVRQYLSTAANAFFLPPDDESIGRLIHAFVLDKALYELSYELNHRPPWVPIPLEGILSLIQRREAAERLDDDLDNLSLM